MDIDNNLRIRARNAERRIYKIMQAAVRAAVERNVPTEKRANKLEQELIAAYAHAEKLGQELDALREYPERFLPGLIAKHKIQVVQKTGAGFRKRVKLQVYDLESNGDGLFTIVLEPCA